MPSPTTSPASGPGSWAAIRWAECARASSPRTRRHWSFGDYGPQSGDGTAVIGDEEMDAAIEDAVAGLLGTTP
jgi:hypothetical protein